MRALAAWVVHCLTAGGAAIAVLALLAIEQGQFNDTLAWLVVALVFDGIDGPIARAIGIKQIIPQIDGAVLDLVVDYLTFVFIPAHLMLRAGLLPESMALYLVLLINGSALYHYSRTDMKTPDNYFRGFPALWNVIAFYLWVGHPGPWVGCAITILFSALTFAPVYFVHPIRVRDYQPWLLGIALIWAISSIALFWPEQDAVAHSLLLACSLSAVCSLLMVGLIRGLRVKTAAPIEAAGPK